MLAAGLSGVSHGPWRDAFLARDPGFAALDAETDAYTMLLGAHGGQPGAILRDRDGLVVGTIALDVLDGRIQTIRSVVNPDKLTHLGPVGDAWAVAREVKQARRREV